MLFIVAPSFTLSILDLIVLTYTKMVKLKGGKGSGNRSPYPANSCVTELLDL